MKLYLTCMRGVFLVELAAAYIRAEAGRQPALSRRVAKKPCRISSEKLIQPEIVDPPR